MLLLFLHVVRTHPWRPSDFPDPKRDVHLCGRGGRPSNICDPDNVLNDEKATNRIEGILKDIWEGKEPYAKAPCGAKDLQGYQVAVAIMRKMEVKWGRSASKAAQTMAKSLHARWGVGDAACDNGVLLLLAVEDRQVYISTGKGARRMLSDSLAGGVIEDMKSSLRKGDYVMAVMNAVVDIGLTLSGQGKRSSTASMLAVAGIMIGIFLSVFAFERVQELRNRRRYEECKSILDKINNDYTNRQTRVWSLPRTCPICFEEFARTDGDMGDGNDAMSDADPGSSSKSSHPTSTQKNKSSRDRGSSGGESLPEETEAEEDTPLLSPDSEKRRRRLRSKRGKKAPSSRKERKIPKAEDAKRVLDEDAGREDATDDTKEGRSPVTVCCGHTFCKPCIGKWLEKSDTCPICREKIVKDESPSTQSSSSQSRSTITSHLSLWTGAAAEFPSQWYEEERTFRLRRLSQRYPGLVNFRTGYIQNPVIESRQCDIGSVGNSFSFGGGSGSGGGGAGGSW